MIKLMTREDQSVEANSPILFNWDVPAQEATGRPANHNLTEQTRGSNVVLLGGYRDDPDFRPDLGARLVLAA